ncbi:MAG: NAD(P)/FAD-dependent oxidoreductase [Candidatus Eutrophobiaceae bacterium]
MRHAIIGAGPAGIIAAEQLRRMNPQSKVTVFGDENEIPYSRMALPYLLNQRIEEQGVWLRKNERHYDEAGIDVRRQRVASVDPATKTLKLDDGASVSWDSLLIATGSHPITPPIPGIDLPGVHSCWTLKDARAVAGRAVNGARVVLMGAGFIGSIILEALALRKVKLSVIEMEDRMVPRMMNQISGNLIKKWCESKGVQVYTSTKVEAIEQGTDQALRVKLAGGEIIDADLVISATGVRSNIDFLAGSGIELDQGVLVDDTLQTNKSGIYAAGDVCQGRDFSTGEYSVQAIQPTAAEHALICARNMCGGQIKHRGSVNMNVLDTLGLISSSYGSWMGVEGGDGAERSDEDRYRYISLQFKDDVLVGAQAVGLTQHIGVLRGLIQTRVRLGKWKAHLKKDPTRIMEAYLGSTQSVGFNGSIM